MDLAQTLPRYPTPPVLELLEAPRGLGLMPDELTELIAAADDRLDVVSDASRRAVLERGRNALERELGRIAAL